MAVVQVWASINGTICHARNSQGNLWTFDRLENCPDGYYVCEFWASDEVGNIGYTTQLFWLYDGRFTCVKPIEDKWKVKYLNGKLSVLLKDIDFSVTYKENFYSLHVLPCKYSCHYLQRVRCNDD